MGELHDLAKNEKNSTDKGDHYHTFHGQSYLHVYEHYFNSRRTARSILEIGVLNGCSLRLWRDYFSRANVFGLDIDPARAIHSGERIKVVIGDQSNPQCLSDLARKAGGFDIVIDDGSHIVSYILTSLNTLWPFVRPGGLYVIEDLGLSHTAPNTSEWLQYHPGMALNGDLSQKRHERSDFDAHMLRVIRCMDSLTGDVRAIHFHPMVVIIEKV